MSVLRGRDGGRVKFVVEAHLSGGRWVEMYVAHDVCFPPKAKILQLIVLPAFSIPTRICCKLIFSPNSYVGSMFGIQRNANIQAIYK